MDSSELNAMFNRRRTQNPTPPPVKEEKEAPKPKTQMFPYINSILNKRLESATPYVPPPLRTKKVKPPRPPKQRKRSFKTRRRDLKAREAGISLEFSIRLRGIWNGMKYRCFNPSSPSWEYYGGRGISMCSEWAKDFYAFQHWVGTNLGEPPDDGVKYSIDRINNDGDYEPGNIRWATPTQQVRNSRRCIRIIVPATTM